MTFTLKQTSGAPFLSPLESQAADFGETFSAGAQAERIETDSWDRALRTTWSMIEEQTQRLQGVDAYGNGPDPSFRPQRIDTIFEERIDYITARNADLARDNPELRSFGVPTTRQEFVDQVTARLKTEHDDAIDVLANGSTVAEILGRLWGAASDDMSIATLAVGAPARAGILATIGIEATAGAVGEAVTLPRQYEMADRLDLPKPNPAQQITMGAAIGGALGGGIAGAGRYLEYRQARRAALDTQRPEGAPAFGFGDEVEAAARELKGDPVIRRDSGSTPARQRPTVPPGAPDNWAQIRNGIFAGESGGDYGAVFGFQNRPGGKFADVDLTRMTLDQWLEFSAPTGSYGQWVKSRIGRVATPMGAYQVVGTTLRAAKKAMGLRGDEIMDAAMQDRIGLWIYRAQGTGAWEGYRGPRSTPPSLPGPDAPAPSFSGYTPTSRGYTASGQITAGDGIRIDVDYEVVDLSQLQRASGNLQPRDRSRAASDEQIAQIAAGLDPARLMPSPEADRGAPIVGPDNVVESGNGRTAALGRVYDLHPDRADAYRQQIAAAGYEIPEGVERPVLIARRRTELDDAARQELVRAANTSQIARMSATERSRMEARGLTTATMSRFRPGHLASPENAEFVRGFLDSLPQAERSGLVDAKKVINAEGLRRLGEALFARAWDAPDIVARFAETDAGELRSLLDALSTAAPEWAALRAAVADGRVRPEMDITPFILDAMRTIAMARDIAAQGGGKVASALEDLMSQSDLLTGDMAPLTVALIRKFAPNGRAAPADRIAQFLKRYAAEAEKIGSPDAGLFDAPGPLDALKAIDREHFGQLTEIGRALTPPAPQPQADLNEMPGGAFADGAASPEAETADAAAMDALRETVSPEARLREVEDPVEMLSALKHAQPFETIDDLFKIAPASQRFLEDIGQRIAEDLGVTFKSPGLKKQATASEKMLRKHYDTAREMTDVVRAGFVIQTADEADQVVARLSAEATVFDEGWRTTADGYFDRKVLVVTPNGVLAEMQIWSPQMLLAKQQQGHALYERARSSSSASERAELHLQMRQVYADALSREDASFSNVAGTSNAPKVRSNLDRSASSDPRTGAVVNTSIASTGSQAPPGLSSASASPRAAENSTAGRPSQSQNVGDVMGDTSASILSRTGDSFKGLGDLDDLPFEDPVTGITTSFTEYLADIDADGALATVVDLCGLKGGA